MGTPITLSAGDLREPFVNADDFAEYVRRTGAAGVWDVPS